MARHMFFGGNTANGFYSGFSHILYPDESLETIYLKGSSGGGKSTLMRKIAKDFENKGLAVDYIHCSNNVDDLDGICIRQMGIAIVDGTAPHVCDPMLPVAIDEIFNTADFIKRDYIKSHGKELLSLQTKKKAFYYKAYNYLNAAYKIFENNYYIYEQSLDKQKLLAAIQQELMIFNAMDIAPVRGRNRKMFASAVTPQGCVSFMDSLTDGFSVIALKGMGGMGMDQMLETIGNTANSKGLYTEGCYCALNPEKLEHLLIPNLKLCFTTVNEHHLLDTEFHRVIDFTSFCNMDFVDGYREELDYNKGEFESLLKRSMNMMASQKTIHDRIEKIYIASLDFKGLNKAYETISNRLIGYMEKADLDNQ